MPMTTVVLPRKRPGPQIKASLQKEVRPSLILPLSTRTGEKHSMELLTKGWITLGKTSGSSESSVNPKRMYECEVSFPL